MSTVYKLAFASSALPSRMIGILDKCLNKCTLNGLCELNSLSNEQYLLCLKKANYQQMFRVRSFTHSQTDSFRHESSTFVLNCMWQWQTTV